MVADAEEVGGAPLLPRCCDLAPRNMRGKWSGNLKKKAKWSTLSLFLTGHGVGQVRSPLLLRLHLVAKFWIFFLFLLPPLEKGGNSFVDAFVMP